MKDKFGLRPLPKDKNDFNFGRIFAPIDTPNEFILPKRKVKNQGNTDMCASYATCLASEYQENVDLYPPYTFALSKIISRDVESWGQNLRDIHKAHQRYGAIEMGKTAVNSRYIADYPDMYQQALKHAKKSYFKLSERYIKGFIYKNKQPVVIGIIWSWSLQEKWLSGVVEEGFGHAITIVGFKGDYYVIQNSYGEEAGEKGIQYLHKDTAKHFIKKYGCYGMTDMPIEQAREANKRAEWNYAGYIDKIRILLRRLWNK